MEYIIVIILILFSALFSGLTLGFFSLNKYDLRRKAELGGKRAKKIYQVRENGNLLLTTLLIGNVAVNSALSIFLGSIASGAVALIIATALIVIFGEIIPQAVFSRYALDIGAKFVPLIKFIRAILIPITWPIAKILDKILGSEIPTVYSRHELMKIIEDHEDMPESELDRDEEKIIKGALSFSHKTARDIMTPKSEVFLLEIDEKLNQVLINKIYKAGHSRMPVYEKKVDNIVGLLYVKNLIASDFRGKKVRDFMDKKVLFINHTKPLDKLLNAFRRQKIHLAIVVNEYNNLAGVVSIEDVIEEIIGAEIMDEFDKCESLQKLAKQKARKRKINKI